MGRHKKAVPTDRVAYQQEYYLKRKAELAERKRVRFQADERYREIIAVASRACKGRLRAAKAEAKARARAARGGLSDRELAQVLGPGGGATAWAARVVGVDPATFRRWVRLGAVPTPGHAKHGHPRYTEAQAVGVAAAWALYQDRYVASGKRAYVRAGGVDVRRLRGLIARQWAAVGELVEENC